MKVLGYVLEWTAFGIVAALCGFDVRHHWQAHAIIATGVVTCEIIRHFR